MEQVAKATCLFVQKALKWPKSLVAHVAIATCASAKRPLQARVRWHDASQVAWSLLPGTIYGMHIMCMHHATLIWFRTLFSLSVRAEREIFEDQQEIKTLTVIWARQLVSPQPKLGPVPYLSSCVPCPV